MPRRLERPTRVDEPPDEQFGTPTRVGARRHELFGAEMIDGPTIREPGADGRGGGPGRGRRRVRPVDRPIRALVAVAVVSVLMPLLLFAVIAWQMWKQEVEELDGRVDSTLSILSEEAEKVFQNQALALAWVDDRMRGLDWKQIGQSRDFYRFAKGLADGSHFLDTIFVADAAGIVRLTTSRFPIDRVVSVADRDYFLESRRDPTGIHVGDPAKGRFSGKVAFRIARRRTSADGSFDGIVAASLSSDYFTRLFRGMDGESADLLCLLGDDGRVLVSSAGEGASWAAATDGACTRLARAVAAGREDFAGPSGATMVGGTRRLSGYPIVFGYAVAGSSVRRELVEDLWLVGVASVVGSAVLFALSYVALRVARGERRAIDAWRREVENRRRVEAQVVQATKMESLGRMASGIAHHFNNLLPAISGLVEATRDEVPRDGEVARRLTRILEAVEQGRQLVRGILLFSRRQVLSRERVAIAGLVADTVAFLGPSLPANVRVVTRLEGSDEVTGDRAQLQEALMNLVANAVQAIGPNEGTIGLEAGPVTLDAAAAAELGVKPGDYVRVTCRDDGAGMPPEVIEHVFDPFFTTKPAAEGTGLGLAIVHGVVTGIGGGIRVESAPGEGACFSLYLPVAATRPPAQAAG